MQGASLALVLVCAGVAFAVRSLVAADTLSDAADLALTACGLVVLLAGLAVSIASSRRLGRARVAAPLALLLVAAVFSARSFDDASVEANSLTTSGPSDAPAAVVALGPDGTDVRFSGEIGEGDAARLATLLDAHPAVTRIHLTSEGGLVDEGEAMATVIAAHRLSTYVPDFCVSACTLAFVAGRERLAQGDARLGFHAPYEQGLFGQTISGDSSGVRQAYLGAGLSPAFVTSALDVASDDMWYPEARRLLAAHVVTAFVDGARLPDSNLDGDPTPAGARAVVLRNAPILAGLADAEPVVVQRIARWYLDAYRHAWTEQRAAKGLHTLTDGAVALASARASDVTLVGLARFAVTAMDAADEEECQAIGTRGDIVTAASVLGETGDDAAGTASGLLAAAIKGPRVAAAPALGKASVEIAFRAPRAESCTGLKRAYAAALSRPIPEAATLLRPRFAEGARRALARIAPDISQP